MNKIIKLMLLSLVAIVGSPFASLASDNTVYCHAFETGYSLFRTSDNKDIGSAYFLDLNECQQAADLANQVAQNVACSPYINGGDHYEGYSAYRISDGKDLGNGLFGYFEGCQSAISHARNGVVCLVMAMDTDFLFAPYEIETGNVLGDVLYDTIEACQQEH